MGEPSREPTKGERIVAAAIKVGPVVHTGPHHATIIHNIVACGGAKPVKGEQGFMTSRGRFVSRKEGALVAYWAGQVPTAEDSMFSEQLWIVPNQCCRDAVAQAVRDERELCAWICDQHAENQARHGEAALAEQSRQDALAIRHVRCEQTGKPVHMCDCLAQPPLSPTTPEPERPQPWCPTHGIMGSEMALTCSCKPAPPTHDPGNP